MKRSSAGSTTATATVTVTGNLNEKRHCWACNTGLITWPKTPGTDTLAPVISCGVCNAWMELYPKKQRPIKAWERVNEVTARTLVAAMVVFMVVGGVGVALPFHLDRMATSAGGAAAVEGAADSSSSASFPSSSSSDSYYSFGHHAFARFLSVSVLFSYAATLLCRPGRPPVATPARIAAVKQSLGGTLAGCRICTVCSPPRIKLPGTSHCSTTGQCVLRFDHHCVFVGRDIGLFNHRVFLLFLLYLTAACFYVLWWVLPYINGGPFMGVVYGLYTMNQATVIRNWSEVLMHAEARQIFLNLGLLVVAWGGLGMATTLGLSQCQLVSRGSTTANQTFVPAPMPRFKRWSRLCETRSWWLWPFPRRRDVLAPRGAPEELLDEAGADAMAAAAGAGAATKDMFPEWCTKY